MKLIILLVVGDLVMGQNKFLEAWDNLRIYDAGNSSMVGDYNLTAWHY
jgi:hypothetical protein